MRIVVKVGTNVLRAGTERIHRPRLIDLARQLARLKEEGHQPLLVSSGAIFAGRELLGRGRPSQKNDVPHKQMLAAVGQGQLLSLYQKIFEMYGLTVAQALLTRADLANRTRYLNARNTFHLLLRQKNVIPVINENDVVAVDEIKFGDNDNLSALAANLVEADLLVILTDQRGLFTADPRTDPTAQFISQVHTIDSKIKAMAGGSSGDIGTGGMTTKIEAAELATRSGTQVVIAPGKETDVILRVVAGEPLGTRFLQHGSRVESRKRWILAEPPQGSLTADGGAVTALVSRGKSLLVVGITRVSGDFERGAIVRVLGPDGHEVGRGLAHYKAADLRAICGKQSGQIASILGFDYGPTAIHRDNLIVTQNSGETP
ncbi:MAG: glutamate 5-kinase [Chloroflexi bacterium]|nr:MAG: glutamate 5-kinase [Chloroflexota bacterium]